MFEEGDFAHYPVVREALGAPLDSDAPSPPVPFFLAPPEGTGGTFSDRISKKAVLVGAAAD
jgi:hypothetical protein